MTELTEILLVGTEPLLVRGDPQHVEAGLLAAARGSLMELAWFEQADDGRRVGINPEHVVLLRAAKS